MWELILLQIIITAPIRGQELKDFPYTHNDNYFCCCCCSYERTRVYKYNVSCPEGFLAYFRLLSLDLDPNS